MSMTNADRARSLLRQSQAWPYGSLGRFRVVLKAAEAISLELDPFEDLNYLEQFLERDVRKALELIDTIVESSDD